jgi:hypothetical protein
MAIITRLKTTTKKQEQIYKGLSQLSSEIAAFYRDALLILGEECVLETKVNLVAHLSREIDGGFRDIFAPKTQESIKESEKTKNGHKQSIIDALGFKNDKIAKEWHAISVTFHGFAHRHGFTPRSIDEFKDIWKRYEKILHLLTGSVYAISDRINHIVGFEEPTEHIIGSLKKFLTDPAYNFQFFNSLSKESWLIPLHQSGFFAIDEYSSDLNPYEEWYQLRYLNHIALKADTDQQKVIIDILSELQEKICSKSIKVDDYSVYLILQIKSSLKNYIISSDDIKFLNFCNATWKNSHKMYESEFTGGFLKKYIADHSKEGIMALIPYCFSYQILEEKVEGFEDLDIYSQTRVIPNLSDPYLAVINGSVAEIINLGKMDLIENLIERLNELSVSRASEISGIPSIEPSEQSNNLFGDWERELVTFLTESGKYLSKEELKVFVKTLFIQKTEINQRIAIHLVRTNFEYIGALFWEWIRTKQLDVVFPIHELYLILRERSADFKDEEFILVTDWIQSMTFDTDQFQSDEIASGIKTRIRKYLTALRPESGSQKEMLKKISDKYEDENSYRFEHPEFDGYTTFGSDFDLPEGHKDLKDKSVADQVAFLSSYTRRDPFNDIPSGLGGLMNNFIIQDPEKYLANLSELTKLPFVYQRQIIYSFCYVIDNETITIWKTLLDTFIIWVRTERKSEEKTGGKIDIYEIAEFILRLSQKCESFNFNQEAITLLNETVISLLNEQDYKTLEHIDSDLTGHMLNNGYGKLFSSLINISRQWIKNLEEGTSAQLEPAAKKFLTDNLSRNSEKDKEFSIGLGMHIPFLLFADQEWCETNNPDIFPDRNELHLNYTISGLFSNNYPPYKNVIAYIKKFDLTKYALKYFKKDSPELNRLCRLALVELFYIEKASLDKPDSLIHQLISNANPIQYLKIVNVCINLERGTTLPVKELWKKMLTVAMERPEEFAQVLEEIVMLAKSAGDLDKDFIFLIEQSVPYFNNGHAVYALIRKLLLGSDDLSVEICQLLIKIWDISSVRPYVSEELQAFVKNLYMKNLVEPADAICDFVAAKGVMGLKAIYDQYHLEKF